MQGPEAIKQDILAHACDEGFARERNLAKYPFVRV